MLWKAAKIVIHLMEEAWLNSQREFSHKRSTQPENSVHKHKSRGQWPGVALPETVQI